MKRVNTTAALLAGSALALALSTGASAQTGEGDYYVSGFAGLAFQGSNTNTQITGTGAGTLDLEYSSGFTLGGAVGYKLEGPFSGLRLELEASYREGDVNDDSLFLGGPAGAVFTSDTSSFGVLANVIYDFDFLESNLFTPYIGFGVGLGGVESDVVIDSAADASFQFGGGTRTQFLYQGIAGVSFPISEGFEFFVDGRYYSAGDVEFDLVDAAGTETPFDSDYDVFSVQAGIRFSF